MGIFDLQLQTEVRPMETPVNQSTSTALAGLTNFVSSMGNYKSTMDQATAAEARAKAAAAPTYTEVKDQKEQADLAKFTTGLADLAQMRDSEQLTSSQYVMKEKAFITNFVVQTGADVSSGPYDAAYTVTTGRPSNAMGLSNTDMAINQLTQTVEGQGTLELANYSLTQTLGRPPSRDEIVAKVQVDKAKETELAQLKIEDELDLKRKLPQLEDSITALAQNFDTTLAYLTSNGIDTTPEMMQNTYLNYKSAKMEILAKLPDNTPQDVKDNLFKLTDAFFVAQGMEKKDGVFVELSKDALQTKLSVQLTVKALLAKGDSASTLMANGLIARGYTIDPDKIDSYTAALSNLDLTPSTPAYITEAGMINSNSDMMSVAQALSSPEVVFSRDVNGITDTLKNLYTPEQYANIQKETAAQGWSNLQAKSLFREGYNAKVILDGTADPTQVYNNLFGFASAIGTIDFTEEAVSFAGLRGAVSTSLPSMIDALEKVDPEKGSAIRKVTFYNIGKAAAEYDVQIKAEEKALNINFNPKSGSYELDVNAAVSGLPKEEADKRIAFFNLLKIKYNGDIVKAVADDFKATAYMNLTDEEKQKFGLRGGRGAGQGYVPTDLIKDFTPDRAMRLLDLRNSRVYLDSVAGQIEPADIKERRMNTPAKLAGETMSTLAATEGTVTVGGITTSPITPSANGYKPPEEVTKDTAFIGKVNSVSTDLGINPNDLLRVIEFETGKSFSPAVKSPNSSATGLIQFMGATAKDLGTTTEALAAMTRAEQMDYVAKYLAPYKGKIKNFGDLYLAVHWPKAIGKDEAYVMYEQGSKEYTANKNLDTNGDGTVTRGETIARVMSGTGGGKMTTPYTAEAEKMIQPGAELLPPELTGGATAPSPISATPTQPMPEQAPTASPTLPEQVQGQQPTEVKTAANTPIDQGILDTIANLSQNAADVRVFTTEAELVKAYDNQEIKVGSLVVVDGKLVSVTENMIFMAK